MSFWTTQKIRAALARDDSPIIRSKMERLNTACYEMALGGETFITSAGGTKQLHKTGDQIRIPPGQFALLLTEEMLRMPSDVLAFISIKSSKKLSGLVNVSGFHVDPGFTGRLKFSVYNAGAASIILEVGEPLFPIWFFGLAESNEAAYQGQHQGQAGITGSDVMQLQGEVASPAALKQEILELRSTIGNWKAATAGALITSVATALGAIVMLLMKWGK